MPNPRLIACAVAILTMGTVCFAQELVEHDHSRGFWLKNDAIEAFIATQPVFRVADVRTPGGKSVMADSTGVEKGMRLAFMGPVQVPASFKVGDQPAEVVERDGRSAKLRLGAADDLQYTVSLAIDAIQPRITLKYELQNLGSSVRRVGCWSDISLAGEGTIIAPFGEKPHSRRRLVMPWWTQWPQPTYRFGRDAMAVDVTAPPTGNPKVGLITDAGWIAVRTGGQVLVSSVTFDAKAEYPEDGANISVFQSNVKQGIRCEIELMGPLSTIEPKGSATMTQILDLFEIKEALPADGNADALRTQVEAARKTRDTP